MAIKVYGTSHLITAASSEVEAQHTAVNNREMVSALTEFTADHPVSFLIESPLACTQQGLSEHLLIG